MNLNLTIYQATNIWILTEGRYISYEQLPWEWAEFVKERLN